MISNLVILINNKSIGPIPKTDYGGLNANLKARSNSNFRGVTSEELLEGDSFSASTTRLLNLFIAIYL